MVKIGKDSWEVGLGHCKKSPGPTRSLILQVRKWSPRRKCLIQGSAKLAGWWWHSVRAIDKPVPPRTDKRHERVCPSKARPWGRCVPGLLDVSQAGADGQG